MEQMEGWGFALVLFAGAVGVGVAFGVIHWIALRIVGSLPQRLPFPDELPGEAGGCHRRRYRQTGRELAAHLGGVLVAGLVAVFGWLARERIEVGPLSTWILVVTAALAAVIVAVVTWRVLRVLRLRRKLRFKWAARAMVGNVLQRLNFSGNRIFHDVAVEGNRVDHVVVGKKGVFAVNVVARRLPKDAEARPAAELRNGKLWMAGTFEALPVGNAARNMTLLAAALTRVVGHRVPVRSVLAVPGWDTAPNGEGNHLVLNENNLAMLTSWNPPEAFLMEEDCLELQKFLSGASRLPRLD